MALRWIVPPDTVMSAVDIPPSSIRKYKAVGTISSIEVENAARIYAPVAISSAKGALFRQEIKIRQVKYDQWEIEIPYLPFRREVGDFTWDFDTTGGTIHITNSKETVQIYPHPQWPTPSGLPDHKGAIDVQGDEVKGIDIVVPALKLNIHFRHPAGDIPMSRVRALDRVTGMVNSTSFFGWNPGEVLFLGARGADGASAEAQITYSFAMSKNADGNDTLTIGEITGIDKKGWDVIWISYRENTSNNRFVKEPEFVYIERVYERLDFAEFFGFGAAP